MWRMVLLSSLAVALFGASKPFEDLTHKSRIFDGERHYRLFLPPVYETSGKRYPVIYYFHGHSDRYTLERYDNGTDTVPKIVAFVAAHDVIVVTVDGYVPEAYEGFYGGAPWDVRKDGGKYDFGEYFLELVSHIDSTLRTLTDRRHRATAGLSMGGFMSLYLSSRYADLVGSASAFNPGPEFYVGETDRRILWRPKDHVAGHEHSMIRLVRASGDYISQYHEETRDAYARDASVRFEYRQDEYHRHWATSIAETFDFHMRAFATPDLDNVPETWNYSSAYRHFAVWGYDVRVDGGDAGFTTLTRVSQIGFRVTTRQWAPDGPTVRDSRITVTTAPLYAAGRGYTIFDYGFATGRTERREVTAAADGRLVLTVDGGGHQIAINGPGAGAQPPVLLPVTTKDRWRVMPQRDVNVPVRVFNPRSEALKGVRVTLETSYPTVRIVTAETTIANLEAGSVTDLTSRFKIRCTAGAGDFAHARLTLKFNDAVSEDIDILIAPEVMEVPLEVAVLDGRTMTFDVFRQKGNQGGGEAIRRTVTEGRGNGNGILEPGEEATIWVKIRQGIDPFDKGTWHRVKVYADSPWLAEIADIEEEKQREWTGAQLRTSLVRLAPDAPPGTAIPLLLSSESGSFRYTPDVRYGTEPLYQAFQIHEQRCHTLELKVPARR